jgi:phosphomannomutase
VGSLRESLAIEPVELAFGTSGLRGLAADMTDLECYVNTIGFIDFLAAKGSMANVAFCVAGDLRTSTERILRAVARAVTDRGCRVTNCGRVPTPALANYAFSIGTPCVMVTGSHIPADRNGIKFYTAGAEVLKADEPGIANAVAKARQVIYSGPADGALFDPMGMLHEAPELPVAEDVAADAYRNRYSRVFDTMTLAGRQIVFYQHSAVGRDLVTSLLRQLGATVTPVGRSEDFVPIDSENVTDTQRAYFARLAEENRDAIAIVSTDGDGDRPFMIDEHGVFHSGDMLGVLVAEWLRADFAAFPISTNDAVGTVLSHADVAWRNTGIGSPFVLSAMQGALAEGYRRVVGWEVNGGFMTGTDLVVNGRTLPALPTRDAFLPIVVALASAIQSDRTMSEMFAALPRRFTQAGLIDNVPKHISQTVMQRFAEDNEKTRTALAGYFSQQRGFGAIKSINLLDGVRIYFDNDDIAHLRPSNNAPQFRVYSVAATQARADEIVTLATSEPDGIIRKMAADTT